MSHASEVPRTVQYQHDVLIRDKVEENDSERESPDSIASPDFGAPLISPVLETASGTEASASPGPKHQAAFVSKLYQMVSDPSTDHLIKWSSTGESFLVLKPEDFAKSLCSLFFKHNNWQSFVRQLNMYQFHKVNDVFHANSSGTGAATTAWEFKHALFKHGCLDLLTGIKRKASKPLPPQREPYPLPSPREFPRASQNPLSEEMPMVEAPGTALTQLYHFDQRVSSIEESQRLLMNQSFSLFSALNSYQTILQGMANVLANVSPSPSTQAIQNDIYTLSQHLQQAQYPTRHAHQIPSNHRPSPVNRSSSAHGQWNQSTSPYIGSESPSLYTPAMSSGAYTPTGHATEPDSYFRVPLQNSHRGSHPPGSRPLTPASATLPPHSKPVMQQRPGISTVQSPTSSSAPQILTPPLSDISTSSRASSSSNVRDSSQREHHLPSIKHHILQGQFSPIVTSPGPTSDSKFTSRPPLDRGRSLQSLLNGAGATSAASVAGMESQEREEDRKRRRLSQPQQCLPTDLSTN